MDATAIKSRLRFSLPIRSARRSLTRGHSRCTWLPIADDIRYVPVNVMGFIGNAARKRHRDGLTRRGGKRGTFNFNDYDSGRGGEPPGPSCRARNGV